MDVYNDSKYFPTLLETASLRVPNRNCRHVSCLMLNLNVEIVFPFVAIWRQMQSTVTPIYLIDVRSGSI
jgi:hypothetical protein